MSDTQIEPSFVCLKIAEQINLPLSDITPIYGSGLFIHFMSHQFETQSEIN